MEKQSVKTFKFKHIIKAMEDIVALHRCGHVNESVELFRSLRKQCNEPFTLDLDGAPIREETYDDGVMKEEVPIRKEVMGMRKPSSQRFWGPAPAGLMPIIALDDGTPSDAYLGKGITTIPIGHGNSHNREMFARGHAHELDSNNFKHPISLGWSTSDSNILLGTPAFVVMLDDDAFARPVEAEPTNSNILFSATEAAHGMKNSVDHHESAISKLQVVLTFNKKFLQNKTISDYMFVTKIEKNTVLEYALLALIGCITKEPNHWVETDGKMFYQNYREYLIRDLTRCGDTMQILEIINTHVADFKLITDLLEITLDVSKNVSDPVLGTPDKYTDEYLAGLTGDELLALAENIHKMYHYSAGRGQPAPRYDIDNFSKWVNIRNKAIHRFNWM